MDIQPQSEREFTIVSTTDNAESAPYHGAFFPRAAGFAIGGGVFTSNVRVTNNVYALPREQTAGFRTILLGDINLLRELYLDGQSPIVGRKSRVGVRRMYSATVEGRESRLMTVAMYRGEGAEEQWREHIEKYEYIRHPNIMQPYGVVSTIGLRAIVFHDELVPFHEFFNRFQYSPILTTYILGYCTTEWNEARDYFHSVCPSDGTVRWPRIMKTLQCTFWIRQATGQLCVDLVQNPKTERDFYPAGSGEPVNVPRLKDISLDHPDAEAVVISTLDEDEYHQLCSGSPIAQPCILAVSTQLSMSTGLIISHSKSNHGTLFRITKSLGPNFAVPRRNHDGGTVMENSWIRYDSRRVRRHCIWIEHLQAHKFWLAQANHILTRLEVASHLDDYVFVHTIVFNLRCLLNAFNTHGPEGYLFVCPLEDFRTGSDSFQWPDCPAYWSLDPSGAVRISTEDARILGFPVIHTSTLIYGLSWDHTVYDGLRRFHRGKGFDPESQELAIHLGYPLYELSSEWVATTACVEEE